MLKLRLIHTHGTFHLAQTLLQFFQSFNATSMGCNSSSDDKSCKGEFCTSRVQPLDVSVNKPFKDAVRTQFEKHLNDNLTLYMKGKITVSEQRVLLTRWVGNTWDLICSNREMVKCSFNKCGIDVNIDGSKNALVHLQGISEYVMPEADEEFHVDTSPDENDTSDEENFN